MVDRFLSKIARSHLEARAQRISTILTGSAVRPRQDYIRLKLLEEIGGLPDKTPLNARITGTLVRGDYRVEKLIFESQPHRYVTANIYIPIGVQPPFPAILGTAGHHNDGKAYEPYQRAWVSLAKRGFLVLAYDPPGQGERKDYLDSGSGKPVLLDPTKEHTRDGLQCLLTGTNVARYFVWDGIRALDYLLTRPDVDRNNIGVTGNSGGGTQTSYLAALEPRLRVAAPSCWLTSWDTLWSDPGPQDAEQVFASFLNDGLDFPDFLIAFAPRPFQMATATRDMFSIEGARATYAEAKRLFALMGTPERAGFFEFDDTHGWSKPRREATYRWLAHWMQARVDDGLEAEFPVDSAEALRCTPTGQVLTSFAGATTIQELNATLAEELARKRIRSSRKSISALVRSRLGVSESRGVPPSIVHPPIRRAGYRVEKIELAPEPGITIPVLMFVGDAGRQRKPAVIYLNPNGKSADAAEGGPIDALVRTGLTVIAPDVRGWGESALPAEGKGGYPGSYQTIMRALLVSRSMAGLQSGDVLRVFDYVQSRDDVDSRRISIFGKGSGGILAVFAATLESRVCKVACQQTPKSYMELIRSGVPPELIESIVPGILRDFDLPEVVDALGSGRVHYVERPEESGLGAWLQLPPAR